MTVRIITPGEIPKAEREATCQNCRTVFSFNTRTDGRFVEDKRDGDYYSISCPLCLHEVTVAKRWMT